MNALRRYTTPSFPDLPPQGHHPHVPCCARTSPFSALSPFHLHLLPGCGRGITADVIVVGSSRGESGHRRTGHHNLEP